MSSTRSSRLLCSLLILGLVALFVGCQPASESHPEATALVAYQGAGPIQVTCTVGMLTDLTRQIGGDRLTVTGLMGAGTDPHLYKTTPGDVKKLGTSDLILYCGHHLEGKMGDAFSRVSKRVPAVAVCEQIPRADLLAEDPQSDAVDPHLWFDVRLWTKAALVIQDTLIEFDPEHAEGYAARGAALVSQLNELHAWVQSQVQSIPQERRVLVTAHDAFRYFGRAYQFEVIGIQGLSTESEASVQKINELVGLIVDRGIPAVFIESTVSEKNVRSLIEGCQSRGHTLKVGGSLYSDAMGPEGTESGTYMGMVRHNVETIVAALR